MAGKFKVMDKKIGELHDFLEDKNILYPESIFLLECYIAKVVRLAREKELM